MFRNIRIFMLLLLSPVLLSENNPASVKVVQSVKTWQIVDKFAAVDSIPPDTTHLNFQNFNHIDRFSISNAYRGNLGSPIQSKVYFDRPLHHDFIFADAYYPYMAQIESATFFNTTKPYTSLYYLSGGTHYYKDDQIRFLFSANANKKLNLGFTLDYLYARGEYQNLGTKKFTGSAFGTYDGLKYKATGFVSSNNLSNYENGGISDTTYINGPIVYPSYNIPVNIKGYANYLHNQIFYNHQYNIGIIRQIEITPDSIVSEYVPVTVFGHTVQLDDLRKRYYEPDVEKDFYENTYLPFAFTNDSAAYLSVKNTLSVSMAEEFNKWLRFGLTAYVENEVVRYGVKHDSLYTHKNYMNNRVGGVLSKNRGELLTYKVHGELTFLGRNIGDMVLDANLKSSFNLLKQTINLQAYGFVKSVKPSVFYDFYDSNHFKWTNNFSKLYNTHISGKFAIPTLYFKLDVSVENLTNPVYFNQQAVPKQYHGNVQILAANLQQDFHVGSFTLENQAVYQLSSHQSVIPLPDLVLYHNLYYHGLWFKVLSMQMGVDMRYHTAYYAPSYMPATGQFYAQEQIKIGHYPMMNVYVNAHLKRTRFFAQYYHVNQFFMKGNYYSMPYYPLNPATFKMGLTWNFYD